MRCSRRFVWPGAAAALFAAALLLASCAALLQESGEGTAEEGTADPAYGEPSLAIGTESPDWLRGVRFYRSGEPGERQRPPILEKDSGDRLVLEFDALNRPSERFEARLVHCGRDWRPSSLSPRQYVDGFEETSFGGGRPELGGGPSYRHYRLTFPSSGGLGEITASGNYLLEIRGNRSDSLLLALPFLVTEQAGALQTRRFEVSVNRESGPGSELRTRVESDYRYPGFVELPRFELHMTWVPDRLWGRRRSHDFLDVSPPGAVRFGQERRHAFAGDHHFRYLDLRGYREGSGKVEEVMPAAPAGTTRVRLQRDVRNFSETPPLPGDPLLAGRGHPASGREGRYLEVGFRLEGLSPPDSEGMGSLYVAGSFSRWRIREANRLRYDAEERLWKGNALLKEGAHIYAYLERRTDGSIRMVGPPGTPSPPREIMGLVYYRDPVLRYDRLLRTAY